MTTFEILKDKPLSLAAPIIRKCVAKHFNILPEDIDKPSRKRETIKPRQIAHYFGLSCRNATLKKVGQEFGNKNHATVLYSIKEVDNAIEKIGGTSLKVGDADVVRDQSILTAIGFIEHYINQEFENRDKKIKISKNREKRTQFHIRRCIKHYHKLKKQIKNEKQRPFRPVE